MPLCLTIHSQYSNTRGHAKMQQTSIFDGCDTSLFTKLGTSVKVCSHFVSSVRMFMKQNKHQNEKTLFHAPNSNYLLHSHILVTASLFLTVMIFLNDPQVKYPVLPIHHLLLLYQQDKSQILPASLRLAALHVVH